MGNGGNKSQIRTKLDEFLSDTRSLRQTVGWETEKAGVPTQNITYCKHQYLKIDHAYYNETDIG